MSELALVEQSSTIDVSKWADTLIFAVQLAEKVHDTEFVPTALRGRPEAVAATIMYGAEVGVTPMQALAGIHIVEGRPAPSAELMRAMILRAGHTITVHEATGTRVRVSGLRRGQAESERLVIEWTTDMARAAGLLGRSNWRNYPRAMLMARATSDLARTLFPDVIKGLGYVAEETAADTERLWGPPEVVQEEEPRKLQRRGKRLPSGVGPRPTETVPLPPIEEPPEAPRTWLTDEEAAAPERTHQELPTVEDTELDQALAEKPSGPAGSNPPAQEDPHSPVSLPELEPEEPTPGEPPQPGGGPQLIGPGALKAVNTMLTRELGTAATAEERHGLLAAILMRPVESSKTLTRGEGIRALSYFDRFRDGEAKWEYDLASDPDDPIFTITDLREPPEDEG